MQSGQWCVGCRIVHSQTDPQCSACMRHGRESVLFKWLNLKLQRDSIAEKGALHFLPARCWVRKCFRVAIVCACGCLRAGLLFSRLLTKRNTVWNQRAHECQNGTQDKTRDKMMFIHLVSKPKIFLIKLRSNKSPTTLPPVLTQSKK